MTGWDRNELRIRNEELRIDWAAKKNAVKYLPKGAEWYDFWTGKRYKGGQTVTLETQLNRVPMFVRAGSIVPMGPVMQYVGEKSWDELELRVYPGADGRFSLYEDEGDSYRYEQGVYSVIPMQWDNRTRTLTIGSRQGSYPGMIGKRTFIVVTPDGSRQTVTYEGQTVTCKL
jgi:alpha-D-xyloside xylohydrolase